MRTATSVHASEAASFPAAAWAVVTPAWARVAGTPLSNSSDMT